MVAGRPVRSYRHICEYKIFGNSTLVCIANTNHQGYTACHYSLSDMEVLQED